MGDRHIVFFDYEERVDNEIKSTGRVKVELFNDICPKVCKCVESFFMGSVRVEGTPVGYKDCKFFDIQKNFYIMSGDFISNDGTGTTSIYDSPTFVPDETCERFEHTAAGLFGLVGITDDCQVGCQFYITLSEATEFDGINSVCGRIVSGITQLMEIEENSEVQITQCGRWS
ncbi:hypothetical protein PCE1_001608 [Barthelona sp. PCE]